MLKLLPQKRNKTESESLIQMLKRVKYFKNLYQRYGEIVLELISKKLQYTKINSDFKLSSKGDIYN